MPRRDPGIMLKQQAKAKCQFNLKLFRFSGVVLSHVRGERFLRQINRARGCG
jgi:hypothetical protein